MLDSAGRQRIVIIPDARYVPSTYPFYGHALLRRPAPWERSRLDAVVRDTKQVRFYNPDNSFKVALPFAKRGGLYI